MTGVEISLCEGIIDYKTEIALIKEIMLKKITTRSNLTSSPTSLSGNRVIISELNISSIDPPVDSDKVLNPYRLGLDLAISEDAGDSNEYPVNHQIGTGFNDGLGNTGYQNIYRSGQVLDSYRFESDLPAYNNIGLSNPGIIYYPTFDQIDTEPNDGLCNTGYRNIYPSGQVYGYGSDLTDQSHNCIDFSKPMTQLLGSMGDLNQNLMGGFNLVAACSDNAYSSIWSSGHDERLSKLERTLSGMKSSLGNVQNVKSEIGLKQSKISSLTDQQENLVSNLNQETLESSRRAGIIQSSVESRMEELGDRIEEIRERDVNS